MRPRVFTYLLILALSLPLGVVRLEAQETPSVDQGLKAYGSFHGADIDSIILTNRKLNLHIPLISYPQRGGRLHAGFFVSFGNPYFIKNTICIGFPTTCKTFYGPSTPGVQIKADFDVTAESYLISGVTHYLVRTPDGAAHNVENTSNGYVSLDATGFHYDPNSNIAIDRKGVQYFFSTSGPEVYSPGKIEDPSGNTITGTSTAWTDTLGRTLPAPPWAQGAGGGVATTDFTRCSGPLPISSAYLWNLPGPSGGTSSFKVCVAQVQIIYPATTCGYNCYPVNGTFPMIQSIVLPNNTAWGFEYNTVGYLTRIDFSAGGSITYGAANTMTSLCNGDNPTGNPATFYIGGIASRSVDSADGTGPHQWTYSVVSSDPNQEW